MINILHLGLPTTVVDSLLSPVSGHINALHKCIAVRYAKFLKSCDKNRMEKRLKGIALRSQS